MRAAFLPRAEPRSRDRSIAAPSRAVQDPARAETGAPAGMPIFLQRMSARPRLNLDSANAAYEHEAHRLSAGDASTWRAITAQLKSAGDQSANARHPYFGIDHRRS